MFCDTYFLDLTTEVYTAGPTLQTCRFRHTCNYIKATKEIVIVGGLNRVNSTCFDLIHKTVEIINVDANTIRYGKVLGQDQLLIGLDLTSYNYFKFFFW